ncbi:unnamed protein product [Leptosia nina]|uniref:Reverse transcriptase n=1 Tax=Leptosia nina TaxID=320188 RepID=A0AAV1J021_9NEOP
MSNTSADVYNEENKTVKNCEDVSSMQLSVSNGSQRCQLSTLRTNYCVFQRVVFIVKTSRAKKRITAAKRPRKERHVRAFSRVSRIDLRFDSCLDSCRSSSQGDWMVKLDISQAYYHVPTRETPMFPTCQLKGRLLQMTCLPFGLASPMFASVTNWKRTFTPSRFKSHCLLGRLPARPPGQGSPPGPGSQSHAISAESRLEHKLKEIDMHSYETNRFSGYHLGHKLKQKVPTHRKNQQKRRSTAVAGNWTLKQAQCLLGLEAVYEPSADPGNTTWRGYFLRRASTSVAPPQLRQGRFIVVAPKWRSFLAPRSKNRALAHPVCTRSRKNSNQP